LAAGTASRALGSLVDSGVLSRTEAGRQHLFIINRRNYLVQALDQLFRAEDNRLNEIVLWTQNELASAGHECGAEILNATIYGSAARGEDRPESDLDLFVVVRQADKTADVQEHVTCQGAELRERFGLRLSVVTVPPAQLLQLAVAADPLLESVVQDGRRVYGQRLEELLSW